MSKSGIHLLNEHFIRCVNASKLRILRRLNDVLCVFLNYSKRVDNNRAAVLLDDEVACFLERWDVFRVSNA